MKRPNLLTWLTGAMLLLPSLETKAQDACAQSLSYDVKETSFYVILDTSEIHNLTELDKVKFKRTVEKKHFKICHDTTGEVTTEISLVNPEEVHESWMTQVVKTVILKDSVKSYDTAGGLVLSRGRSNKSKMFYDSLKAGLADSEIGAIPTFEELTSADIQNLQNNGYSVQSLQEGGAIISNEDLVVYYNTTGTSIETRQFEEGEVKRTVIQKYRYNEQEELVPDFTIHKTRRTFYRGVCVEHVTVRQYTDYQRSGDINPRGANSQGSSVRKPKKGFEDLSVHPNPVTGPMRIQLPASQKGQVTADIEIQDAYGRGISLLANQPTSSSLEIPTGNMQPGIYLLKTKIDGKLFVKRFVRK